MLQDKIMTHVLTLYIAMYMAEVNCYCRQAETIVGPSYFMVGCNLSIIPTFYREQREIRRFDLTKNLFTSVEEGTFRKCPHLQSLSLSYNRIGRIHPKAFGGTIIHTIELHENRMLCLPDFPSINNTLRNLHLDSNRLGECESPIKRCNTKYYRLETMTLTENKLTYLPQIIYCTKRLRVLHIGRNHFTAIPDILHILRRPRPNCDEMNHCNLLIGGNPIVCDCAATWLKQYEEKFEVRVMLLSSKCPTGNHSGLHWHRLRSFDLKLLCPPSTTEGSLYLTGATTEMTIDYYHDAPEVHWIKVHTSNGFVSGKLNILVLTFMLWSILLSLL